MARRDQPYFPLYVQDFLTDEKLAECSAESVGVYIYLLCIMHKSQDYGKILLRQKDRQNERQILNFAEKLVRQMPFKVDVIDRALEELVDEGVLTIDGDVLFQKRMVKDGELSDKRAISGKKGAENTNKGNREKSRFAAAKSAAKRSANSENENENEDITESENSSLSEEGGTGGETEAEVTDPPVYNLPLNDGKTYGITKGQMLKWETLYPAVDVMQEFRKMDGWLEANPRKRKTKRGIVQFITGWLAREQDRGGSRGHPQQAPQQRKNFANLHVDEPDDEYSVSRYMREHDVSREEAEVAIRAITDGKKVQKIP